MGALPRPDLAPGPARELNDALHELHHRAGWPSLRTLAREAGCSHTTVSNVFSSPRLPTWGVVEVLVEAMDGATSEFHDLWLAASAPGPEGSALPARIAGRRSELVAVRRHLESGTGLLLVTGEAGIGKTRLVVSAAEGADCFVTSGHCLPLSVRDPLMPVIDVLRAVHAHDDGQSMKESLSDLHPFFRAALARLLPEIGDGAAPAVFGDAARQHVFAAVGRCLSLLHERVGLGVVFEDLHWADAATLDLLEHLVAGGEVAASLVGTWRTDDLAASELHSDWLLRMQRLTGTSTLELAPLTLAETTEQLSLGAGAEVDPDLAIRIHERSRGHPLFTEQLAAHADSAERPLPGLLTDVLDRRLEGLPHDATAVATALGVADRDLSDALLGDVTELDQQRLVVALHELQGRHLLATGGGRTVQLRHPLLAEAARRRLVPGEAARAHDRLARALAAQPEPNAAEVAEHWQEAGDHEQELRWRVAAARQAHVRTAPRAEAEQWLRALDLARAGHAGDELDLVAAHLDAFDALELSGQLEEAAPIAQEAMAFVAALDDTTAAEILRRAAIIEGLVHDHASAALVLIEQAVVRLEPHGPSEGLVHSLDLRANQQIDLGQFEEATQSLSLALDVCARLDDPGLFFGTSATLAWHLANQGDLDAALDRIRVARAGMPGSAGPRREAYMGMMHTDALIKHRRPAEEVIAAAEPTLSIARELQMDFHYMTLVRGNVAEALYNTGRVREAKNVVAAMPVSDSYDHWPVRWMSAVLAIAEGRPEEGIHTLTKKSLGRSSLNRLNKAGWIAVAHVWMRRPDEAWSTLVPALEGVLSSTWIVDYGQSFVTAARAAADLAQRDPSRAPDHLKAKLEELRERSVVDPLGPGPAPIIRPATTAQWQAELARIERADTVDQWSRAALAWDAFRAPHDSAYCRWRAAEAALREGQGTVADRLLKRAARDAREHVPLLAAIRETADRRS